MQLKAKAARSESQGDGAPDSEALFASNEGAKRPEILAAGASYIKKHPITGRFFIIMHLRLDTHPGIHLNISTIFQLYRTKLKLYQRFF
ncbi:hypothetical protein COL10_14925 [Bacillus cereus]|nr:hypothetical protein CN301_13110 [Bacillus cereus]PFV10798.1 hypothetical protein COL10_14925 [Bacillus cereus]PGV41978.1 hypothetical protein COD74_21805 [Bacillus cereus]